MVRQKSDRLSDKWIGMGICGGIGSVETVKSIRELRRHGAKVTAFFTPSAEDFITHMSVEWAAGNPVVKKMDARMDHLEPYDLVVVAPATLNTITKCALGISDNPVTLLVATQLGRKKNLCFVPTMNADMASHPVYLDHVKQLKSWGAKFLTQEEEEDRLKMPSPETLTQFILKNFL